jgi:hypothetical protein
VRSPGTFSAACEGLIVGGSSSETWKSGTGQANGGVVACFCFSALHTATKPHGTSSPSCRCAFET